MTTTELGKYILDNSGFVLLVLALNFGILFLINASSSIKASILKDLIYIPARNRKENVLLLGGLAMAFSNIIVMHNIYSSDVVGTSDKFSALGYILGVFILTIQGYLDDKFELSIKARLIAQGFTLLTYSVFLHFIFPIQSSLAFILLVVIWGFGILNGSHIIETAQTMSIKVSTLILFYFFAVAYYFNFLHLSYIIALIWLPIACFWIFKLFKKNIRLGEIGPNVLALSYIFIATQIYLRLTSIMSQTSSLLIVLIPLSIPMGEVFFNMTKRLFQRSYKDTKRSNLFLHVLSNENEKFVSHQITKIVSMYALIMMTSFFIIAYYGGTAKYILAFFTTTLLLMASYFLQAKKCSVLSKKKRDFGNINNFSHDNGLIKKDLVETFDVDSENE